MMKDWLAILTLGITLTSYGQTLQDIEKRLRLLEKPPEYEEFKYDTTGFSKLPLFKYFCDEENENKWDYYHVVDLNNDGLKDLIYRGPCMPYSETGIFLNKGGSLGLIHSEPGNVLSIEKNKNGAVIQVLKWPCCCDSFFDSYEIVIHNDSHVEKNLIIFKSNTKVMLDKLKEIKVTGIVRSTEELNDTEKKDDCSDQLIKGNRLTEITKPTTVVQLCQRGQWRLVLYPENKMTSWIGWVKME
jgi:hypothetical protein